MQHRILIYVPCHCIRMGTSAAYIDNVRRAIEGRSDLAVEKVAAQHAGTRRKRGAGWTILIAHLDGVDQVAVMSAADLPARTVKDLLRLLGILRDHGVGLILIAEGIDTSRGSAFAMLDVIDEFRRTKLSRSICAGQAKARAVGKAIGRPKIPAAIRDRIRACIAAGSGIRPTAYEFGVAPGTVINVCRSKSISLDTSAP
jgi:DNA invertase Pin-like site-specific DNA recombinase